MPSATVAPMRMPLPLSQEDQARADLYALIAALLLRPPEPALLAAIAAADPLPSAQVGHGLSCAWEGLTEAARTTTAGAAGEEFDALFISVGMPLLNPYGSRYLTGFMHERPLAQLRDDLRVLGLSRKGGVAEAEDHLGALCEAMRVLIGGTHAASRQPLATQRTFFIRHVAPWYGRCLDDIGNAEGARFYRQVAAFAQAFLDVEFEAFSMDETGDEAPRRQQAHD